MCNGCSLQWLKDEYGDKLIKYLGSWYLKDEQPADGQGKPLQLRDGTPIKFVAWFMSENHCCGK